MKKHGFEISKIIEGSCGTLANMSLKIEAHRSYAFQHKRYLASAFSPYVRSDLQGTHQPHLSAGLTGGHGAGAYRTFSECSF